MAAAAAAAAASAAEASYSIFNSSSFCQNSVSSGGFFRFPLDCTHTHTADTLPHTPLEHDRNASVLQVLHAKMQPSLLANVACSERFLPSELAAVQR